MRPVCYYTFQTHAATGLLPFLLVRRLRGCQTSSVAQHVYGKGRRAWKYNVHNGLGPEIAILVVEMKLEV